MFGAIAGVLFIFAMAGQISSSFSAISSIVPYFLLDIFVNAIALGYLGGKLAEGST